MFGRATIRLGIGPHSSYCFNTVRVHPVHLMNASVDSQTKASNLVCESVNVYTSIRHLVFTRQLILLLPCNRVEG